MVVLTNFNWLPLEIWQHTWSCSLEISLISHKILMAAASLSWLHDCKRLLLTMQNYAIRTLKSSENYLESCKNLLSKLQWLKPRHFQCSIVYLNLNILLYTCMFFFPDTYFLLLCWTYPWRHWCIIQQNLRKTKETSYRNYTAQQLLKFSEKLREYRVTKECKRLDNILFCYRLDNILFNTCYRHKWATSNWS